MDAGVISGEDYAQFWSDFETAVLAGGDPLEELAALIEKIKEAANILSEEDLANIGEGLAEAMEPGVLDNVKTDLDEVIDKADDATLQVQDEATEPINSVLDLLANFATTYTATLKVDTSTVNTSATTGDLSGSWEQAGMGKPQFGVVPPGYPTDGYPVIMKTGEAYAVWNQSKGNPMQGNNLSVAGPLVQVESVGNNVDVNYLARKVLEKLDEWSR
jgi:hypothetical protein